MREKIYSFILFLVVTLFITGCGDDEKANELTDEKPKEVVALKLEREKVSLIPGESISIKIISGNDNYKVHSSDNKIVNASVSGGLLTLTAGAVSDKANVVIVVVDQMYKRASVDVDVANEFGMTLSIDEITLREGVKGEEEATVVIETGNFGYHLELLNGLDQYVEIDDKNLETAGKFVVKGIAVGEGRIKVTDKKGKESILHVTVLKAPSLILSTISMVINAVQGKEVLTVSNGNGGYKVVFDDPAIAKTAYVTEGGMIAIVGKKNGRTSAYIEDRKGLKSEPFFVQVEGPQYAMKLDEHYYGYANFKDIERINPSLTRSKQITFEMRCYMTGYRGGQTFMGLGNNLLLRGPNDDYRPTHPIAIVGDDLEIESSISFKLHEWMHIALVVDCNKPEAKEKYQLYINGVKDENLTFKNISRQHTEVNLASSSDDNKFVVGWATNQYWCRMLGTVSEVRVWKTARTMQQINDNMRRLKKEEIQGLFAHWDFSAGVATDYIQDTGYSGCEINMTLSEVKHDDKHYRPVVVPENVYVPVD